MTFLKSQKHPAIKPAMLVFGESLRNECLILYLIC